MSINIVPIQKLCTIKESKFMIRKLAATIAVAVLAIAVTIIPSSAQNIPAGPPGTGFWVFWQLQNIDTTAGSVSMTAYEVEGGSANQVGSESYALGLNSALAYHPGLPVTFPNGDRIGFSSDVNFTRGSAVISSDVDVVAIAQLGNNKSGEVGDPSGLGKATSFYQGIGSTNASTVVNFPLVKNDFNGQTTTFYIQSAGSDADVTITYKMNDGTSHTESRTIGANRMWEFSPLNAAPAIASGCSGGGATSPCQGAATVESSSGAIVGVVVEHPAQGVPVKLALSTRGLTDADQGTKLLAPIIKNAFNGSTTGFSVQNVGNADATVKIDLTVTNAADASLIGNQYSETVTIAPGSAEIFIAARNNLGGMPAGTFASATVESTNGQKLVGAVNENNKGQKAVYAAFCTTGCGTADTAATKTQIAAPLVKDFFNGKTTGLVVANAGNAPTKMRATYVDAAGVSRTIESSQDIPAGGAVSFFSVNTNPGGRFTATGGVNFADFFNTKNSVTVESTTGQPIVAVAQESARDGTGLDIKNYEGFNY